MAWNGGFPFDYNPKGGNLPHLSGFVTPLYLSQHLYWIYERDVPVEQEGMQLNYVDGTGDNAGRRLVKFNTAEVKLNLDKLQGLPFHFHPHSIPNARGTPLYENYDVYYYAEDIEQRFGLVGDLKTLSGLPGVAPDIKISDQPHVEFQQTLKGAKVELVEKQQALVSQFMNVAEREIKERDAKILNLETRIHTLRSAAVGAGPALGVGYLIRALVHLGQTTQTETVALDMYDTPTKPGSMKLLDVDFNSRRDK